MKLPIFLYNKKCISTISSRPYYSFAYAILFHFYPKQTHQTNNRSRSFLRFRMEYHGLDKLPYPVIPEDIPFIEKRLNLRINVFSFILDGKKRFPIYLSTMPHELSEIDLLFYYGKFGLIKDFSRFMSDLSTNKHRKFFCRRCFRGCNDDIARKVHQENCSNLSFPQAQYQLSGMIFSHEIIEILLFLIVY